MKEMPEYGYEIYLLYIPDIFLNETPAQVFFGELCKNFKNTLFIEHL